MLNFKYLPENTLTVFDYLSKSSTFSTAGMTLMGGTALSLLIGHRLSEDLDFFCFTDKLPVEVISEVIRKLRRDEMNVVSTLDQSQISQARINGVRLEEYVQEYSVNDVKVSFAVMSKGGNSRRLHFTKSSNSNFEGAFFIPDLQAIFESKAVVLMDRAKSRDLFDLMVLVNEHGFTVGDIVQAIITVDDQEETKALTALEVLTGNIPVDEDDPGFESISLNVSLDDIYAFFTEKVNEYERSVASNHYRP